MTRSFRIALVALSVLALGACTIRFRISARLYTRPERAVAVSDPCPPLKVAQEAVPAKTDPASIWVAGHWAWDQGGWVWYEGAWVAPRAGHVWEPPVCVVDRGRHRFHPGYFRPEASAPPPIYREPGHVRMSCPTEEEPNDVPERIQLRPEIQAPENTGPGLNYGVTGTVNAPTNNTGGDGNGGANDGNSGANDGNGGDGTDGPTLTIPADVDVPGAGGSVDGPDTTPSTDANVQERPLSCRVLVTRVPSGGYINLEGEGLDRVDAVRVGGVLAARESGTATTLVVRAGRGGMVTVNAGSEQATCGQVEIIR